MMIPYFLKNKIILNDMDEIYSSDFDWRVFDGKTIYISGSYGMLASYIVFFLSYLKEIKGIDLKMIAQGRNRQKAVDRFGSLFECSYFEYTDENFLFDDSYRVSEADYVIHSAGIANPRFYGTNPVEVLEPNVIGTYNLLRKCDKDRLKGFLFLSSCDVYGSVGDPDNITEDCSGSVDPLDPHSCYSEGKRCGESFLAAYSREYGLRTVIARVGHTFGPTMDLENDPRVFASFMKNAVDGSDIIMHSDGTAKRAFCYISDAVLAYLMLLVNGNSGEAYNVTNTDQMLEIKKVADIISNLTCGRTNVVMKTRNDKDNYLKDNVNRQNRPVEDKIKKLGWVHRVDAAEGFSRVYRYFTNKTV